jgi:hypothetical protein
MGCLAGAAAGQAAERTTVDAIHVVVIGPEADPTARALAATARDARRPGVEVAVHDPTTPMLLDLPPGVQALLDGWGADPSPRAYVCTRTSCSLPTADPTRLRNTVERLARPR